MSDWVDSQLDAIRRDGRWRATRAFDAAGPVGQVDGRDVVSFAGNDYLGLSTHPDVVAAAHGAIDRWGTGATASRLVVGTRPVHHDLEDALARWKGTEAAVVFPSGFAANVGVLTTLGGPDCLVVSDEWNHASIIDGARASRSRVAVYAHGDVEQVDALLAARTEPRAIVVTDAVFSMDGDVAPIGELADCCARHDALLVLDEAHAVFDLGVDRILGRADLDVVRVVTLSKALGSMGGAVCARRPITELLVNRARSYIFTTALSPADAAAGLAAVGVVTGTHGPALLGALRARVDAIAPAHPSPIVPVLIGEDTAAVESSDRLLALGLWVPAIRPPTVPVGTARLRVTLSAAHAHDDVARLEAALVDLGLVPGGDETMTGSAR